MELKQFEYRLVEAGKRHIKIHAQFAKLIKTFEESIADGGFPTLSIFDKSESQFTVGFLGQEWLVQVVTEPSSGAGILTAYYVKRLGNSTPTYTATAQTARIDQSGNLSLGGEEGCTHTGDADDVRATIFIVLGLRPEQKKQ